MKNAFRAGWSLVGVGAALLTPAVAAGQIDAGQTVGQAVGQVGDALSPAQPQPPVPVPAAPVQPASPPAPAAAPQAPSSAPAGPGPAQSGAGGSAGGSGGGTTTVRPDVSPRKAGTGKAARGGGGKSRGGGKARAAADKKANGAGVVLAQTDTGELDPPPDESFSGAVTTSPDTGVTGDPELPFTGGPLLLLLATGIVALAAGLTLRTVARRRHVG
jgi:hypothetical protein